MSTKRISVSYRVSARFKELLEVAAKRENRSQTNLLETLLLDFCRANKIEADSEKSKL